MHEGEALVLIKLSFLFLALFILSYYAKKIGIPVILSFIIAGFIAKAGLQKEEAESLKIFELSGIILLFFFLGLEYSFEKLKGMVSVIKPGIVDLVLNFGVPFLVFISIGFDVKKSLVLSAVLYPSSSSIVAKLFIDSKRIVFPEAELLIGILIFEDLISIILVSFISQITAIGGFEFSVLIENFGKIVVVFGVFYLLHKVLIPRVSDWLDQISEDELFSFFILGIVLLTGFSFRAIGISEVLGAFLLGVLVPETKISERINYHLFSFKELSIGIFFFFFAYRSDIILQRDEIIAIALISAGGIILKIISTYIAGYIYGLKRKARLRGSFSFVPRGEFSIILTSFDPSIKSITFPFIIITSFVGSLLFVIAPKVADALYPPPKKAEKKKTQG